MWRFALVFWYRSVAVVARRAHSGSALVCKALRAATHQAAFLIVASLE